MQVDTILARNPGFLEAFLFCVDRSILKCVKILLGGFKMPSYLDKVQKQVTTAMAASSSAPEAACRCQFSDNSNNILGCDTSRSTCVCVCVCSI